MKAQSGKQPSNFSIGVDGNKAVIFLRENIIEKQRDLDGEIENYWEYDEYYTELINRENINQYITDNFSSLLQIAKQKIGEDSFWKLNAEVQKYIYSKYDQGTQSSFLSLHSDPTTPESAKQDIESVWVWIRSVMGYYYSIKQQLLGGIIVDYDFAQFDSEDPKVKLSDLMS